MSGTERNPPIRQPGADPLVGSALADRYEIQELIGEGGMGRVYRGRQRALDRSVAVKCIHPHLLSSEPIVVRFLEEARVASQIVHPNIVKIYDFGRTRAPDPTTLFIVMELLTGPDLASVIATSGPLPLVRVRAIALQLLSALGEAHAHGVTHRDAKPDNIILEPTVSGCERAKLIDFGIAKVHGAPGVTAAGQFIGTPCYMPPEQIRGENSEISADLYSVGVTLFQMLTGKLPFYGDSLMSVLEQQLYAARPDPRDVAPTVDCPASLASVCRRAIDADPERRYRSADLFAEALEESFAEVLPPENRRSPYPPPPNSSRPAPRPAVFRPSAPPPRSEPAASAREVPPPSPSLAPPSSDVPPPSSAPRIGAPEAPLGVDLTAAETIERVAEAAIANDDLPRAEQALRSGLELGQAWLVSDEREAGAAAIAVFGRKLGAVLRTVGRLTESVEVLEASLGHVDEQDLARARLLVELVATLGDAGRVTEAEAHRLDALRIASRHSDRELTARLRRQAQSLALALATLSGSTTKSSRPPPSRRPSDFRMKPERGQTDRSERARRGR